MVSKEIAFLLFVIALDYVSGLFVAFYQKKINSTVGREGIYRKIGIIICCALCMVLDFINKGIDVSITPMITLFFIINESFSILENLAVLNVPIPKVLYSHLEKINENFQKSVDIVISLCYLLIVIDDIRYHSKLIKEYRKEYNSYGRS